MSISREIETVRNILDKLNISYVINNIIINYAKVPKETFHGVMYEHEGGMHVSDMIYVNDTIILLMSNEEKRYIDKWKNNILISRDEINNIQFNKLLQFIDESNECNEYIEYVDHYTLPLLLNNNSDVRYICPYNKILVYHNHLFFSTHTILNYELRIYNMTTHKEIFSNVDGLLGCIYNNTVIIFDNNSHKIISYSINNNFSLKIKYAIPVTSNIIDMCIHDDMLYVLTRNKKTIITINVYNVLTTELIRNIEFSKNIKSTWYYTSSIIVTDEFMYVITKTYIIVLSRLYVINNDNIMINIQKIE